MLLILYSKPGCHLCEGLQEKLEQILADPESPCKFDLDVRDITTQEKWFRAYQYEVPVLCKQQEDSSEEPLPRPSPRINAKQLETILQKYL
ncbi:MAG: glutaredoxin family protein [Cyanobacteriota bacterium]|nr:glutaredoxin family protein [Cyanobacteriota bacterium]